MQTVLGGTDVLVIAHPSEPRWESTTGVGEPRLTGAEIEAIVAWVESGGGLIVLGETEQEKYGNNLNELLARFGVEIENATVQDYEHHRGDAPSWILANLVDSGGSGADPLAGIERGLLLPCRHAGARQRRPDPRPRLPERVGARRAAGGGDEPRRRPRRRPRRLRSVRRRLHRRPRP